MKVLKPEYKKYMDGRYWVFLPSGKYSLDGIREIWAKLTDLNGKKDFKEDVNA